MRVALGVPLTIATYSDAALRDNSLPELGVSFMVRTRRTRHNSSPVSADRLIRLWLLRLLVSLAAHREFIGPNGMNKRPAG